MGHLIHTCGTVSNNPLHDIFLKIPTLPPSSSLPMGKISVNSWSLIEFFQNRQIMPEFLRGGEKKTVSFTVPINHAHPSFLPVSWEEIMPKYGKK